MPGAARLNKLDIQPVKFVPSTTINGNMKKFKVLKSKNVGDKFKFLISGKVVSQRMDKDEEVMSGEISEVENG